MASVSYVYDVRRGTALLATGQLSLGEELRVGDRMTVGQHTGLIRSIFPGLKDQLPRAVIELPG